MNVAEPRQRWRIVFRRRRAASEAPHRELVDQWLESLVATGLPLMTSERNRPKPPLSFAAPLPARIPVDRDLADLVLTERLPIAEARRAVVESLPAGFELVDLFDVWVGAPSLAASVAAADYRVELAAGSFSREDVRRACERIVAAGSLVRDRPKGGSSVRYDLRPLFEWVRVDERSPQDALRIRIRTRFDAERGTGRPEEVVAAVADVLGRSVDVTEIIRERILLADDLRDQEAMPACAGASASANRSTK